MDTRRRSLIICLAALTLLAAAGATPAGAFLTLNDTSYNVSNGINVSVNGSVDTNTVSIGSSNVFFKPRLNVKAGGVTTAEVRNLSNKYITITEVDGATATITATTDSNTRVKVRSEVANVTFRRSSPFYAVDDGVVDFVYKDFDADTTADIAISPVDANRQMCAVDADTQTELDCARSSGTGVARFDSLTLSSHRVLLQAGNAPNLNDTSASPQPPNEFISDRTTDLEINVTDKEFPSDTVDVEFFVEGKGSVGTDTLNDEGRATVANIRIPPGQNEWFATATDSDGLTDRSQNFTVTSPGIVTVKNNNDGSVLNNETVTAEFFTNSGIETKTTNNGEIDMINLPNQDMRVDFSAKNFSTVTYQFSGVDFNETVFMQPTGSGFVDVTFTLDDRTGNFPPSNTTLIVEESKSGDWTAIASENFGSTNEVNVSLDPDVTYRLRIRNNQNDTRVLQTYSPPSGGETKTLLVEEAVGTPAGGTGYRWDAEYRVNKSGGNDTIHFEFSDPKNDTTDLVVGIYERGNRTNNTIFADNFTGPHGEVVVNVDVPPGQENKTWVVNASADRRGEEIRRVWVLRQGQNPLDFGLSRIWRTAFGVVLLLTLGFVFGGQSATLGGIVIPLAAGLLWYINWLPTEIGLPAIVLALFIGVANSVRSRDGDVI